MLKGGANVVCIKAMRGPACTLLWGEVYNCPCARYREGCFVEVEMAKEACIGGEVWLATGGSEKI